MLTAAERAGLRGLVFSARGLVEGLWAGRHASPRFGAGLEFHDYRIYAPGDDPSEVDWKVYGRTDRYYVKRHEQQTDLHAYLLLDCSPSMHFSALDRAGRPVTGPASAGDRGAPMTKLRYGATLAAAIALLTIQQSDRAGVGLYADRLASHLPPMGSRAHLQRILAELERVKPIAAQGDVKASLAQAHAAMRRRGLLVLISDLLDEPAGLFEGLGRFRHDHFDVIVFQVLAPQEVDLRGLGRLRMQMVDAETRRTVATDLGRVERRYAELMAEHVSAIRRGCLARGIDYRLLLTDEPPVAALRRFLVRRGRRLR